MSRGFGRGGRGRGGGSGSGGGGGLDLENPKEIIEYGEFVHPCENDMVFKTKMCDKIPKFNAPIFLENKVMIGTVDEVFGPVNDVYFTVKPKEGFNPASFKVGGKCFISPERLLNASMFEEPPPGAKPKGPTPTAERGKRGRGGRGNALGGRGGGKNYRKKRTLVVTHTDTEEVLSSAGTRTARGARRSRMTRL
jgi:H/ACA ribonucleoprotein complex subunit 1